VGFISQTAASSEAIFHVEPIPMLTEIVIGGCLRVAAGKSRVISTAAAETPPRSSPFRCSVM
jgi:hypothetical protein